MPWPTKSRTTEKPLRLDAALHGGAEVSHPPVRPGLADRRGQRLARGDLEQPARLLAHRADRHGDAASP